ncbi:hypothetical protein IE81DRAFT_328675 [Ceraceosorus guamensis]|uniref:HCP-like protein n=1 Tax=Ceraceosorus guamensis TaxID=1522189 RepID=A0A316W482_9BASI|nr:hypothetical protein IE81DRAFT_328675 [Ceraceosorus guamensis]PWN44539.1 hypothetical protein IE81DRAFT_328675 [Ceraceosorus guamensis]
MYRGQPNQSGAASYPSPSARSAALSRAADSDQGSMNSQQSGGSSSGRSYSSGSGSGGRREREADTSPASSYTHSSPSSSSASWIKQGAVGSPLDALVQGMKSGADPDAPLPAQQPASRSQIYNRAFALSRSTSIKRAPPQVDERDTLEQGSYRQAQQRDTVRSEEERRREEVRRQRAARLSSQSLADRSEQPSTTSARAIAEEDEDDYGPRRFASGPQQQARQRESSQLLSSNAFRSSMSSDASFNTITGDNDRSSIMGQLWSTGGVDDEVASAVRGLALQRRGSIDTVRSSEFGENGRWGKAWANKVDDEESLYGDSEWGGRDDGDDDVDDEVAAQGAITGTQSRNAASTNAKYGGHLGTLERSLASGQHLEGYNGTQAQHIGGLELKAAPGRSAQPSHDAALLQPNARTYHQQHHTAFDQADVPIQPSMSRQHVVSLTPTIRGSPSNYAPSRRDTLRSIAPELDDVDAQAQAAGDDDDLKTPMLSGQNGPTYRSGQANTRDSMASIASVSTITPNSVGSGSSSGGSDASGPNGAHVFVWPPTPSASVSSHEGVAGASSSGQGVPQGGMSPMSAVVETVPVAEQSWTLPSQQQLQRVPVGPSAILARGLDSPILSADGHRRSSGGRISSGRATHGHPAGRMPPPAPRDDTPGYSDPNAPSPYMPAIGKMRAQAIKNADGRESLVSDLDVETLRLENSTRRDSSSTLASSRMSVGTVLYEPGDGPQDQSNRRESLESMYSRRSHHSGGLSSIEQQPNGLPSAAPRQDGQAAQLAQIRSHFDEQPPRRAENGTAPQSGERWAQQDDLHRSNVQTSRWPPQGDAGYNSAEMRGQLQNRSSQSQLHPSQSQNQRPPSLQSKPSSVSIATTPSARGLGASLGSVAPGPAGPLRADTRTGPTAAEEFLSQGISYHESGDLARSAYYFERSARVEGGCVVGMCMWGMALREGWGARKDPRKGFEWISRAAARAGEMMSTGASSGQKTEAELRAIRSELKLSVYELGKCFCYGWGVKMDKRMALEYFELAAKLGDADSQAEAGALLAAGKGGCKKDLKKAAKYYRMAPKGTIPSACPGSTK